MLQVTKGHFEGSRHEEGTQSWNGEWELKPKSQGGTWAAGPGLERLLRGVGGRPLRGHADRLHPECMQGRRPGSRGAVQFQLPPEVLDDDV